MPSILRMMVGVCLISPWWYVWILCSSTRDDPVIPPPPPCVIPSIFQNAKHIMPWPSMRRNEILKPDRGRCTTDISSPASFVYLAPSPLAHVYSVLCNWICLYKCYATGDPVSAANSRNHKSKWMSDEGEFSANLMTFYCHKFKLLMWSSLTVKGQWVINWEGSHVTCSVSSQKSHTWARWNQGQIQFRLMLLKIKLPFCLIKHHATEMYS
jgi:hypothetical protein